MSTGKDSSTISIIIPTYNRAGLIGRALMSVLNQTYQDFEIIIVDDCSTDNTQDVAGSFKDERIIYIYHEKRKGLAGARNTGIKAAGGQYLAFLDDDDEWLPEKSEKQINKIQVSSDKVGIIYCGVSMISQKTGRVVDTMHPTVRGNAHVQTLRYAVLGGGSTPLIKKECFQKVGFFDEDLPYLEDWEMWMRISQYYKFDFIPDILVKRYIHGYQMTTIPEGKIQAREKIFKKHYDELSKHPLIFADHLNRLGILCCYDGNLIKARRYFLKSIKKRPMQRFAYFQLLPLILMPKIYRKMLDKEITKKSIDGTRLYW